MLKLVFLEICVETRRKLVADKIPLQPLQAHLYLSAVCSTEGDIVACC